MRNLAAAGGRRGLGWTFALGRTHGLADLKKRRAWLQQLHDSDRAYYGWLLAGVLWVLALLGFQLRLEGFMAPRPTWTLERQDVQSLSLTIVRFVMGIVVYTIAVRRLLDDRSLRRSFDRTIATLEVKGLVTITRTPGRSAEAVELTAEGRNRATLLTVRCE